MTEASRWRLELAAAAAAPYCTDPAAVAVAVTGSVSRGCADRYSDVEIAVFWREVPPAQRRAIPGATLRRDLGQDTHLGFWSEECAYLGVKVDAQHWAVEDAERALSDLLERFDVTPLKQAFAAALHDAIPLAGADWLGAWRRRLDAYPEALAIAMVTAHLRFGPHAWLQMLAARDDVLALAELRPIAMGNVLGCLLGLNRRYHPGAKWLWRTVDALGLRPPDLPARLRLALIGEPALAVPAIRGLIDDTVTLVERHLPRVDTAATRARLAQGRPVWDAPPAGLRPV